MSVSNFSRAPPPALTGLDALRRADWLTGERAAAYGRILFWTSFAIAVVWIALSHGGVDPIGRPLGADFMSFWTASRLALGGHPAAAYDVGAHHAAQTAVFGRDVGYAAFFYPPMFLILCLPLGLLPYLASLAVWLAATGLAYVRVVRAWLGERAHALPALAFPAVLVNAGHGQNGFLSAALFGAGALWLERRPILAGVCFGCLVYKPQLGLMIPVALLAAGRWKTLFGAAGAAVAFSALSLLIFGAEAWRAFLVGSSLARSSLEQGLVGDAKMQSAFAAVRLWGGGVGLAYGVQAAVLAFAVAGLVWLQRHAFRGAAEGPAMVVAALLASPFLLDYDLILLAIPLAWMVREGARTGFLPWEKTTMLLAFVLPAISRTLATQAHIPLAPPVMGVLFLLILRRGSPGSGAAAGVPESARAA